MMRMRHSTWFLVVGLTAAFTLSLVSSSRSCPICGGGLQRTLADEIRDNAVVVLARRSEGQKSLFELQNGELRVSDKVPKTKFDVLELIKGEEALGEANDVVELLYFGEDPPEQVFLIQAVKLDGLIWNTPLPLDDRALNYVKQLRGMPEKGIERLLYFFDYLEDKNPILARDSYDEISRVPYADIAGLKDRVDREQMMAWITDPKTATSHKRLYMMLLGLVARDGPRSEELGYLEGVIKAEDDTTRTALDATITCYLTLRGPEGMDLIEDRFLKNKDATYSEVYATIMALRFHAEQETIVPRERVVRGFRHLLERSDLADLIIADLARMEDWTVMDRLVDLFKNADKKSNWVRVPVIQYLKACPLPKAEEYLDELAEIDPKAIQRAALFVPVMRPNPAPPPTADTKSEESAEKPAGDKPAGGEAAVPENAGPKDAVPENAVPKNAAPENAAPEDAGPKKTGAQTPVGQGVAAVARNAHLDRAAGPSKSLAVSRKATGEDTVPSGATQTDRRWLRYMPLGVGLSVFALLLWARRPR